MLHVAALVCAYLTPSDITVSPLSKDDADALWIQCQDMGDEFHQLFTTVYERLHCVHQTLQGYGRGDLPPSIGMLVILTRLVTRFQAAVTKHRELNLLIRFATKRSTLDKLKELHRVIDTLFKCVGIENHQEMTKWKGVWVQQCDRMYALFEIRVKKPQVAIVGLSNAAIAEMLAIMKFEMDYHKDKLTHKQFDLMQKTAARVVRCSNVHVPKISAFFIPSVDMELGLTYEPVRGCELRRGMYDQETRLVAQYLSADSRYARQLFWSATEIWHGFEHPNVVKMVGESLVGSKPCVVWEHAAAHSNFIHYFAGEHENNQRRLWRMFLQVARGLNYIHQEGQTHGNLKCSHILVSEDGTPKICHFELSKGSEAGAIDPWKGPEYNLGTGLDPSAPGDVYAFGLCIIEARTGDIPYGTVDDDELLKQLRQLECYPQPENMRDDEWEVVKRFVAHDPAVRPTMAQAVEMIEELARKEAMEEKADAHSVMIEKQTASPVGLNEVCTCCEEVTTVQVADEQVLKVRSELDWKSI